jgi:hypothetical protein
LSAAAPASECAACPGPPGTGWARAHRERDGAAVSAHPLRASSCVYHAHARSQIMTFEQPPLDRQVEVQIDRLIDEDGGQHSHEEIEHLAHEVASAHADAPVQQYVPNLIYNEVKSKLVRDQGAAPEGGPDQRAV